MERSIPRGPKRRIVKPCKEDQQSATDKLFEISYFGEEKFEDESKMLSDDIHRDALRIRNNEKREEKEPKNSYYYTRPKSKEKKLNLKEYRTIRMTQITEQFDKPHSKFSETAYNIFNTLQSKHVFVGLKKQISHGQPSNPQFQNYIEFKPKRRIDTMPVIERTIHRATIRTNVQQIKNQVIDSRLAYKIRALFGNGHSMSNAGRKESKQLFQTKKILKQKLRRDIFGISERRTGMSVV